jgi:integrase
VLTPAEEMRYFEAARKYPALYDLGRIMILQGPRPDEVMRARVSDVSGNEWTIRNGKSKSARRTLVLTTEAKAILEARAMAAGPSGWLFPGKKKDTHLSKLNGSHEKVLDALNPEGTPPEADLRFVMYDLRHTFATRMAAAGVPLSTLAKILGHSSLRMVMKYVHPTAGDVAAAMKLFESTIVKLEEKSKERVM